MATYGEISERNFFSTAWQQIYEDSTTSDGDPEWYYISAPCFVAQVACEYNIWSSAHSIVSIDYYDWTNGWNNGTWVSIFYYDYINGKNEESIKFFHNRDDEPRNATYNFEDKEESRVFHLWRLRVKRTYGNANAAQRVNIWAGGVGLMTSTEYEKYAYGRYFISNGSNSEFVWRGGRSADSSSIDAEALSKFNPFNLRGSYITAANGEHLVPYFKTKEELWD